MRGLDCAEIVADDVCNSNSVIVEVRRKIVRPVVKEVLSGQSAAVDGVLKIPARHDVRCKPSCVIHTKSCSELVSAVGSVGVKNDVRRSIIRVASVDETRSSHVCEHVERYCPISVVVVPLNTCSACSNSFAEECVARY